MKISLFGGSGRLGTAMKRLWAGKYEIIAPSRDEFAWDRAGFADCVANHQPDVVINTTAYNNVDLAEGEGKNDAMWLNGEVPGLIALACKEQSVPFIHVSSDMVFAGDKEEGYVESDEAHPGSVYGVSKLSGEVRACEAYPEGTFIIRTSRLYGKPAEGKNAKRSFVEIIKAELETKPSFDVNDKEVSSPTFVDDLVRHIETHVLLDRPRAGIYHMANAGGATWLTWAKEIRDILHLTNIITARDPNEDKRPVKRPAFSVLRSTKLPPMRSWQEALKDYLQNV